MAAASDLSFVMKELAPSFQKRTGHALRLSFGSSGNFFAQIQNGAPFDVFLSADIDYPRRLEAAGLAEPGSLYRYAVGRIVVFVPRGGADVSRLGLKALLEPAVGKVAIANPRHAPYGRAAVAALKQAGLYEAVKSKLVFGENVSQAAQFVESGNADAGIIALSLAMAPAMRAKGSYWEVPLDSYPSIEQGAVILASARHPAAARAFLDFLKTAETAAVLRAYGFGVPREEGR